MWFKSVFLKTLRDYRIPILGWGFGMGFTIVSPMASVAELISTPAQRAALATLAAQFAWNAAPIAAETVGGYATFKIGIFVFIACIWPLLAASRMLRGEEERGSLDVLLSAPRSRLTIALQKVAAMWVALLLIGLIAGVVAYAGGTAFKGEFSLADAILWGVNLTLICMVIGGVALLISQFTHERGSAAGATGALLIAFIVVDMFHRVFDNLEWLSRLSPIYYYNESKPLIPSHGVSGEGILVQLALAVLLTGAAVWLFVRRDVGDVVKLPFNLALSRPSPASTAVPAGEWSLRSVYTRSLGMIAMATFWWTLGFAAFAVWLIVAVHQLADKLQQIFESSGNSLAIQILQNIGGGGKTGLNDLMLGAMFEMMPVLLMAFAVTQVNRWSSDEDDGRLDLVLATPQSRSIVMLGRFAALATATVIVGVVTLASAAVSTLVGGVAIDTGHLAQATLGMIPMGLLIAAIGYLASGWLRTAADTGLISFVLAAWFLISFVGPDLKWPDATLRLSAFYYYGTPLVNGLNLGDLALLVIAGALALVAAIYRFTRKDILPA